MTAVAVPHAGQERSVSAQSFVSLSNYTNGLDCVGQRMVTLHQSVPYNSPCVRPPPPAPSLLLLPPRPDRTRAVLSVTVAGRPRSLFGGTGHCEQPQWAHNILPSRLPKLGIAQEIPRQKNTRHRTQTSMTTLAPSSVSPLARIIPLCLYLQSQLFPPDGLRVYCGLCGSYNVASGYQIGLQRKELELQPSNQEGLDM